MACAFMVTPCGTVEERGEEQEALRITSSNWENHSLKQDPFTLGGATFCDLVCGAFYFDNRYLLNAYCIHCCRD